jgi:hypothetical protein
MYNIHYTNQICKLKLKKSWVGKKSSSMQDGQKNAAAECVGFKRAA